MADLSPAANAVLDAVALAMEGGWILPEFSPYEGRKAAAALRAAADRVRRGPEHWEGSYPDDYDKGWNEAVDYFTAIAAELEGAQ